MSRSISRILAAAFLSAGLAQGAGAYQHSGNYTPVVVGTGEDMRIEYVGAEDLAVVQPRAVLSGSGENVSVRHPDAPAPQPPGYVAVLAGSGENISVVHVPVGG